MLTTTASSVLLLLHVLVGCLYADSNNVIVNTPSGKIKGIYVDVDDLPGSKTVQFRGIPYAKPPLDDLRFQKPLPIDKWKDIKDATMFGPSCMQPSEYFLPYRKLFPNFNFSEDCLILNIYVPTKVDNSRNKTVMVWIHGGGYIVGQGMFYDPSYMAVKGDVIVVTINYRLGVFGFATLKDKILRGNYALWDQIEALKWIKKNINAFGGNPNSITIFGESAGGFSVTLLALIPSNKGLFHRVITQSGVANSLLAMAITEPKHTLYIGKQVGCNSDSLNAFLYCFRKRPAELIINASKSYAEFNHDAIHLLGNLVPMAPVIDNELFTDLPENLIKNSSSEAYKFFSSLDFMIGNVNSEGSLLLGSLTPEIQSKLNFNKTKGLPYDIFCENIVQTLTSDFFSGNIAVKDAICRQYGVRYEDSMQGMRAVDMYTDMVFMSPGVTFLRQHARSGPRMKQYQYIVSYGNKVPSFTPPWFEGAGHTSQMPYLFDLWKFSRFFNVTITPADLKFRNEIVSYFTNFAKTGNPNGPNLTRWPAFEIKKESYLTLDTVVTVGSKYNNRRIQFWLDKIPLLIQNSPSVSKSTSTEPVILQLYIALWTVISCHIYLY